MQDAAGNVARALHLARSLRASHTRPLVIGVVNNMPDAALTATENHYCRLLADASDGMVVELKFFSLPEIQRGAFEREHIAKYYEPFAALGQNPPDGLIVTGAEPRARSLAEEPFWPSFTRLADWAEALNLPVIWSCLAAHAAVLHTDGIERRRLPAKLSGVFECKFVRRQYQITHGFPAKWRVPHSRLHGLRTRDLEAHGYTILSQSWRTGADMFMRQTGAMQLFLQGHPEYDPATLLLEYRRDLLRAQRRQLPNPPAPPNGVWQKSSLPHQDYEILRLAKSGQSPKLLSLLDHLLANAQPHYQWGATARTLYTNWLTYLTSRQKTQLQTITAIEPVHPTPILLGAPYPVAEGAPVTAGHWG